LRQAREDYLRQLVRKLSHVRFSQASPETSARGLVVMRLTVSRDGRLVDESLARSSGFPELDRGVMEAVRKASPFAPLPADLGQDRYTFMVPINYVRDR
jgi:protein TonB